VGTKSEGKLIATSMAEAHCSTLYGAQIDRALSKQELGRMGNSVSMAPDALSSQQLSARASSDFTVEGKCIKRK
jgi:hypothetical protein